MTGVGPLRACCITLLLRDAWLHWRGIAESMRGGALVFGFFYVVSRCSTGLASTNACTLSTVSGFSPFSAREPEQAQGQPAGDSALAPAAATFCHAAWMLPNTRAREYTLAVGKTVWKRHGVRAVSKRGPGSHSRHTTTHTSAKLRGAQPTWMTAPKPC
eukprot:91395-Rhodomonas_salina.1